MSNYEKVVVLTGFEPFGGFEVNPSWEAVKALKSRVFDSFKIEGFKIPLAFKEIKPIITEIIDTRNPSVLISLGQSYRPSVSLEKIALNFADLTESAVLYNCGTRPKDEILEYDAPAAYFTTLPIRKILNNLQQNGIPAEISYAAGTFGCNQIFYHEMHKIYCDRLSTLAGLIHVPSLPSQAAQLQKDGKGKVSSMSLDTTVKALEIAVHTCIETMEKCL